MDRRRAKVTRIDPTVGSESLAEDVPFANGVIEFPPSDGTKLWGVYVPMHGLEAFGYCYRLKELPEQEIPADRRVVLAYKDTELIGSDLAPCPNALDAEYIIEDILDAEVIG